MPAKKRTVKNITADGPYLGTHASAAGGVDRAVARAKELGCRAFQLFVKNNNRWEAPPISPETAAAFKAALAESGIEPANVFAHTSYLINLASANPELAAKSLNALIDELKRCEQLGIMGLVMHPGSPGKDRREEGIAQVARLVAEAVDAVPGKVRLLYEGTVGAGTHLGAPFEDLRDLLRATNRPERVGICLDTCHLFAAGHDLRTKEALDATIARFDSIVGLQWLRAFHLNDSKGKLGSKLDRHEHIGDGELGEEAFRALLNHPALRSLPMVLETDKDEAGDYDRRNLATLRRLAGQPER